MLNSFRAPQVSLNTPRDLDLVCIDVGPLLLAPGSFFGVSAATRTLAAESRGACLMSHLSTPSKEHWVCCQPLPRCVAWANHKSSPACLAELLKVSNWINHKKLLSQCWPHKCPLLGAVGQVEEGEP